MKRFVRGACASALALATVLAASQAQAAFLYEVTLDNPFFLGGLSLTTPDLLAPNPTTFFNASALDSCSFTYLGASPPCKGVAFFSPDHPYPQGAGINLIFQTSPSTTVTAAAISVSGLGLGSHDLTDFNGGVTGELTVTDLDASPPSPVPEPDAWALLLVGFGALGGLARSRRRRAQHA